MNTAVPATLAEELDLDGTSRLCTAVFGYC
jgi:hypothetical protein